MLRARVHCKCVLWDIDFPEKINKGVKQSMSKKNNFPSVIQWLIVHCSLLPELQCWPGDQLLWASQKLGWPVFG